MKPSNISCHWCVYENTKIKYKKTTKKAKEEKNEERNASTIVDALRSSFFSSFVLYYDNPLRSVLFWLASAATFCTKLTR